MVKYKELKSVGLPVYFIDDCQEWEAVDEVDFKDDDVVDYEVKINLNDEDYILITKKQ